MSHRKMGNLMLESQEMALGGKEDIHPQME